MKYSLSLLSGLLTLVEAGLPSDAFFQSKTVIIPKDAKLAKGGEDSADSSDSILVVADGVGGWAEAGIDSGFYSNKLT